MSPASKLFSFLFLVVALLPASGQSNQTQRIKGVVVDRQSEQPLFGVTVELLGAETPTGAVSEDDGRFVLENIPFGRHSLRFSYLGYESLTIPNVLVTAGKEVVLDISLSESVLQLQEIVVSANAEKDRAQNDMASVSARSFNLEEVTRFSGGRNDVARLAGSFAGVAVADDSRNDIVVRGNSPTGILWRLEGIPIPNPNHFSTLGTTGGPVSAINPNLLRSSDFLTSAFPAEYGNALSGVFDLGFRSGNRDRHEFTFQMAAFSGLEAMAEGPLKKDGQATYLVSGRYSFVELADAAGIPVGTNATPNYRDLSFKVDFGSQKSGRFSLFGILGTSNIDFLGKEIDENDLFAEADRDSYVKSGLSILGLRHNLILGKNGYLRTVAAFSRSRSRFDQDELPLQEGGPQTRLITVDDINNTLALSSYINQKLGARQTLRFGLLAQVYSMDALGQSRDNRPDLDGDGQADWGIYRDFEGSLALLEAYVQNQYRINEKWTLHAGLHSQYLDKNGQFVLEPRTSLSWAFTPNQKISLGYGLHHQNQPLPVFFYREETAPGVFEPTNEDLEFTRSHHFVLGYDLKIGADWRLKAETYYQAIGNAPVDATPSSFSMLNAGANFVFPEKGGLVNEGTGTNTGVEFTLEKFFSKGYYGLVTASLFDSKYKGSDGIERNSAFNNGYVFNALAGKEVKLGTSGREALTFDFKFTTAGGRYVTPVNLPASQAAQEEVLQEDKAFSLRNDPYLRLDFKIGFQRNSRNGRMSQQFFIDLQNITDNQNIFTNRYNRATNQVNTVYQSGFFPDILYRIQF